MTVRRVFLAPVLVGAMLLACVPAASAETYFTEFVSYQEAELISPSLVKLYGTVECGPAGEDVLIEGPGLQQGKPGARLAIGRTSGNYFVDECHAGETRPFVADIIPVTSSGFRPGPAIINATARRGEAIDVDDGEKIVIRKP